MSVQRYYHAATVLLNGKILIIDGHNGVTFLSSVELYDSLTGLCTITANMSTVRQQPTASVLLDGKILVTGGHNETVLQSTELY